MILVLAGTSDGRNIVKGLVSRGYKVIACAATQYGKSLLEGSGAETVGKPLSGEALELLIKKKKIDTLIDATHPYAEQVSATAAEICRKTGTNYIRYQRPASKIGSHPLVYFTNSYEEAAEKAAELGEVIFLATGSKTLKIFFDSAKKRNKRVVARVLPDPETLKQCFKVGLKPSDIVAIQGPFSIQLNKQLLSHYNASVLVTKDGGALGGFEEKLSAAIELGIPVVIVKRPDPPTGAVGSVEGLLEILKGT